MTALTSAEKRNTPRNLLLLALPGGRVLGSNDQMTLVHGLGSPCCAATRFPGGAKRSMLKTNRVANWFPPLRLAKKSTRPPSRAPGHRVPT